SGSARAAAAVARPLRSSQRRVGRRPAVRGLVMRISLNHSASYSDRTRVDEEKGPGIGQPRLETTSRASLSRSGLVATLAALAEGARLARIVPQIMAVTPMAPT